MGWTSAPNNRGTIDILWDCGFTILLCTWTVLCVNISPPGASTWYLIKRKAWLALICWMGRKFLFYLSVHQWQSARRSFREFRDLGLEGWTLKHAFYGDMGGFVLQTSDDIRFPLTSKHLHFLIAEGFIDRD